MSRPQITVVGEQGLDYVGQALALYGKFDALGQEYQTVKLDNATILLKQGDIKIIMDEPGFAVTEETGQLSLRFHTSFPESVPGAFPEFTGDEINLATLYPGLSSIQLALLGYSPTLDDQIAAVHHDRIDFYAGAEIARTITFITSLRSTDTFLEIWNFSQFPQEGATWIFLAYLNQSHGVPQVKLMIVPEDATEPSWEYDADFGFVQTARDIVSRNWEWFNREGVPFLYFHDTDIHSGNFYGVEESDGTLVAPPFGLPVLPDGTYALLADGVNTKREDYFYRLLSPTGSSLWNTVCKTAIANLIHATYGSEGLIFDDMTARVERRDQSSFDLLDTFSLDPSAVDTTLQGISVDFISHSVYRFHGEYTGAMPSPQQVFSRFLPIGGAVLQSEGIDYPLVIGYMLTENTLSGSYGLIQQPTILWVGGTADDSMFSWDGVDAVGLSITKEIVDGVPVDFTPDAAVWNALNVKKRPLSWLFQFQRWISDGAMMMFHVTSWEMAQQVITVKIIDAKPVMTLIRYSHYHQRIAFTEV
jgi:hypothetical protein